MGVVAVAVSLGGMAAAGAASVYVDVSPGFGAWPFGAIELALAACLLIALFIGAP
jgi:hypothetical protein